MAMLNNQMVLSCWIFHVDENPLFFLWNLYECSAQTSREVCPMVCQWGMFLKKGAAFWGLVPDGEFPLNRS